MDGFLEFSKKTQEKVEKPKKSAVDILSFNENDLVTLKAYYQHHATEHSQLYGHSLQVKECKSVNLGDMITEVVYLKSADNSVIISNPYLSKYFKRV